MIAKIDEIVSPTPMSSASEFPSSASASSFMNLRSGGRNDNLNPTAPTFNTVTDACAAIVVEMEQQHQRGRLQQCQMYYNAVAIGSGNGGNIGTRITATTRRTLFHRRQKRVNVTMTSILLLPIASLLVSYTTALVYHSVPTNILARRVSNVGNKISILSTTSLFYKLDANDSYSDPSVASANNNNANNKNGGEEEGTNSSSSSASIINSTLQFARAKRARKLHRHPSKKAKKKSGKESNDDIIVELLPSTFADDYFDDDEQTPFILSEPGEGETWIPPLPSSSSSSPARTSAATTSESCSKLDRHPALVLNADYQPLRMLPLSIWSWQDTIKAVLSGKAVVVDIHPNIFVRAVSLDMPVPSVIALREYAPTGKAVRKSLCRSAITRSTFPTTHQLSLSIFRFASLLYSETGIHPTQCLLARRISLSVLQQLVPNVGIVIGSCRATVYGWQTHLVCE